MYSFAGAESFFFWKKRSISCKSTWMPSVRKLYRLKRLEKMKRGRGKIFKKSGNRALNERKYVFHIAAKTLRHKSWKVFCLYINKQNYCYELYLQPEYEKQLFLCFWDEKKTRKVIHIWGLETKFSVYFFERIRPLFFFHHWDISWFLFPPLRFPSSNFIVFRHPVPAHNLAFNVWLAIFST